MPRYRLLPALLLIVQLARGEEPPAPAAAKEERVALFADAGFRRGFHPASPSS
jgi:hypothetical protein